MLLTQGSWTRLTSCPSLHASCQSYICLVYLSEYIVATIRS